MSHPVPGHDYGERVNVETDKQYNARIKKGQTYYDVQAKGKAGSVAARKRKMAEHIKTSNFARKPAK